MAEQEKPATAYRVEYVCDECRHGHMLPTGEIRVNAPHWPHMCNNCGYVENYNEQYPTIRYRVE